MNINKIYYKEDEPLFHKEFDSKRDCYLWKILYNRVLKNVNNNLINIENFKKIVFNLRNEEKIILEDSKLPLILLNKENKILLDHEDVQYYLPLSISFCTKDLRYEIILVQGELEFRVVQLSKKEFMNHKPLLSVKNLKVIEQSFDLLLKYLKINS